MKCRGDINSSAPLNEDFGFLSFMQLTVTTKQQRKHWFVKAKRGREGVNHPGNTKDPTT